MSFLLPFQGSPVITVPTSARLVVYSDAPYTVARLSGRGNEPPLSTVLFNGEGAYTGTVVTAATQFTISGADAAPLWYSVGTDAFIPERNLVSLPASGALNATGALTLALISTGVVTSTTAAAVAGTLPTGAVMDLGSTFAVNDVFLWSVVNTGGTNAFTVTAATGHTVVGAGAVAANTSGRFQTRKTAADTFVTTRI